MKERKQPSFVWEMGLCWAAIFAGLCEPFLGQKLGKQLGVWPTRLLVWTGPAQTNKMALGSRPAKWVIIGLKLGPNKCVTP